MSVTLSQYEVRDLLGEGGFSQVFLGVHRDTQDRVALKILQKTNRENSSEMKQVHREIDALTVINHPNVLRMHGVDWEARFPDKNNSLLMNDVLLVVLELAEGGELFDFLSYTGAFDERIARTYFHQLISGIKACHEASIAHRDLKPENLLLDAHFNLKIADFGFAHMKSADDINHIMRTECGTRGYMAPEVISGSGYGQEADIFSAGVVLFIMLAGFPPFQFATKQDWWFDKLINNKHDLFWKAHTRQAYFSDSAKDLINKILSPEPSSRLNLDGILAHEWFTGPVLSEGDLKTELENKKTTVQREKRKEKEALARKRAKGRVRGGAQRDVNRSIDVLSEEIPDFAPTLYVGARFDGPRDVGLMAAVEDAGFSLDDLINDTKPVLAVYDEKSNVECYTSFLSTVPAEDIFQYIQDILNSARWKSAVNKNAFEIRTGFMTENNGYMDMTIKIFRTEGLTPMQYVQFRRIKGDVLQFRELFDEMLVEFADLVYIPPE